MSIENAPRPVRYIFRGAQLSTAACAMLAGCAWISTNIQESHERDDRAIVMQVADERALLGDTSNSVSGVDVSSPTAARVFYNSKTDDLNVKYGERIGLAYEQILIDSANLPPRDAVSFVKARAQELWDTNESRRSRVRNNYRKFVLAGTIPFLMLAGIDIHLEDEKSDDVE